jgi:hypothetical protein
VCVCVCVCVCVLWIAQGSYVSDNSIGLQVDAMKAPVQMLAMSDAEMYKVLSLLALLVQKCKY